MAKNIVISILLCATCMHFVIGYPQQPGSTEVYQRYSEDSLPENSKVLLHGEKTPQLRQATWTFLNVVLAALAPFFGRITNIIPLIGNASNAVTGTINNGIVSGFAIPIEDENRYSKGNHTQDTLKRQEKSMKKWPSKRKSKNHV